MPQTRSRTVPILFALAVLAVDATAVGLGPAPQSALLGQRLDVSIPLRLEPGESVADECVGADVMAGDSRVASAQVRARVDGTSTAPVVRVTTLSAIDEPVVSVDITVGCPPRLSRRFVLFADPAPTTASSPIPLPVDSEASPPVTAPPVAARP